MFVASWAPLWFALSLPLIVLMYILKRIYTDTEISSSMLWRRALREQEANRPWQRLRRQLLLLLQLLAAALLVLALLDPHWLGARTSRVPVVVVLDTSAGMTAVSAGGETALAQAKREIRNWLDERGSAQAVTLIATGAEPEVLASGDADLAALRDAIAEARPNYGQSDPVASLTLADALLRGEPDGEIRLYSDGLGLEAALGGYRPAKPLQRIAVPDGMMDNLAVAAFGIRSDESGRSAVVTLINYGASKRSGEVEIGTAEGRGAKPATRIPYALEGGEQRSYTLDELPESTAYRATIGSADGYSADNTAYAFPAVGAERRALLVSKGNLFLDKALQLAGVKTVIADPDKYVPDERTIAETDWVVLDGAFPGLEQAKEWQQLFERKPVWRIRPADATAGATGATGSTTEGGSAGGTATGKTAASTALPEGNAVALREHPVIRHLSFGDTHIARLSVSPADRQLGDPLLTYGGLPAIYAGTRDGKPELLFAFDLRDSDLPLRPEFPILAAQAAEWMSGGLASNLGSVLAGGRVDVQIAAETAAARWVPVEVPLGDGKVLPASTDAKGLVSGEQTAPPVPGLYRFAEMDEEGRELSGRLLSVAASPAESVSAFATAPGAESGGEAGGEPTAGLAGPAAGVDGELRSLIPWIAALLVLLLAAEWGVYRRGTAA